MVTPLDLQGTFDAAAGRWILPAAPGTPARWMTARSIAMGIASTRAGALAASLATPMGAPSPWPEGYQAKLAKDEDFLVRFARHEGLTLVPVRPR
jgi:hypothetical protein